MSDDQEQGPEPSLPSAKPAVVKRRAADVAEARAARAAETAKLEAAEKAAAQPSSVEDVAPGDVLWVRTYDQAGGEQAKDRPWIVISHAGRAHKRSQNLVIAVPLTTKVERPQGFRVTRIAVPAEYIETTDDRFKAVPQLALSEHVRAISLDRCEARVGRVETSIVDAIRAGVRYLIGC